ncbi:box C/D snoRNA protein 1 isoform X2 [Nematostella vectensis]|nr:box C/D snoRNA protein 1 isoform X2 [Nematostella vectensis]
MLNDYRFLEDTGRVAYSATRDASNKRRQLNRNVTCFLKQARRSGVCLKLMAHGMKKRKENSSFFDYRKKHLMWRLHWVFPHSNAEYSDKRVSEHEVIGEVLKRYIDPIAGDPVVRQRLKLYCQAGVDNICIFMKKENQPANKQRFYRVDMSKSIREFLQNKTIIEFPSFHVVLCDKSHDYPTEEQESNLQDKVSSCYAETQDVSNQPNCNEEQPTNVRNACQENTVGQEEHKVSIGEPNTCQENSMKMEDAYHVNETCVKDVHPGT